MIKAILFDFDGTLADTLPFYVKAYDRALQKIGFTYNLKEIPKICFGKSEEVICTNLGVPEKTEIFTKEYFSAIKELFKFAPLFDDTIEVLGFLKSRNIKIIVITFAYRWYIDQMMSQYSLQPYVDFVISKDDVVNPKPDPEAILKAVDRLSIAIDESLVVGDSKSDILMGKAAGSKTALFTREEYDMFYSLEELKKTDPDFIVTRLSQIKKIVS